MYVCNRKLISSGLIDGWMDYLTVSWAGLGWAGLGSNKEGQVTPSKARENFPESYTLSSRVG